MLKIQNYARLPFHSLGPYYAHVLIQSMHGRQLNCWPPLTNRGPVAKWTI